MARGKRNPDEPVASIGNAEPADGGGAGEPIVNPREIDAASDEAGGGNPNGSDTGGEIRFNKDGSIAKKRGRAKGWRKEGGSGQKAAAVDVNAIQYALTGMHALLAMAMYPRNTEMQMALALTKEESETLANNAAAVARHYDIVASQKSIDWFNLIMSVATIEGPRLFLMARNAKTKPVVQQQGSHFVGKREPVTATTVTPTTAPASHVNGRATHRPSDEERNALLTEPTILTPMHG